MSKSQINYLEDLAKKLKNHEMSKESFFKVTGVDENNFIEFDDYLSGEKKKHYITERFEGLTDSNCPIDGTPILDFQGAVNGGYYCPNCKNQYSDISKDGLNKEMKEILKYQKEKLIENEKEIIYTEKVISLLEKKLKE